MNDTHKLMARTVVMTEISRFALEDGENLDARVASEIAKAGEAGKLGRMATRVGLPAIAVTEMGEGDAIGGASEAVTSVALYAPNGDPIAKRSFRVDPVNGGVALIATDGETNEEHAIGVFADPTIADQVGLFWRNGHLQLPA